jgi:hypothetical protein
MPNFFRSLERAPRINELHYWADYVELNCLASPDHLYAPSQLSVYLRRARDTGDANEASTQGDDILDDQTIDRLLGMNNDQGPDLPTGQPSWDADLDERTTDGDDQLTGAALSDSYSRRIDDIWRHLRYRAAAFGEDWPFTIDGVTGAVGISQPLTQGQQLYLFLLTCSALKYDPELSTPTLTRMFERVSHLAFIKVFPGWEAHIFGTAAAAGSRYAIGKLWDRLVLLSQDLRTNLLVSEEDISPHDVGDNGLDLVAWLPLPDKSKGLPMAFGQCACGAGTWRAKQGEVSEDRWGETIKLSSPIQNWTFIPFCYHGPQGDWEAPLHVYKGVLVDRLRMLHILKSGLEPVLELLAPLDLANI